MRRKWAPTEVELVKSGEANVEKSSKTMYSMFGGLAAAAISTQVYGESCKQRLSHVNLYGPFTRSVHTDTHNYYDDRPFVTVLSMS